MYYDKKKIVDIIEGNEDSLESLSDIEDLMLAMYDIDAKVNFLKELKRQRTATIQSEIDKQTDRKDLLRRMILNTLNSNKQKSLNFPGIGRAVMKKASHKWNVIDETALLEELKDLVTEADLEDVTEQVVKVRKKDLNNLLDILESRNTELSNAKKEQTPANVTITYDKAIKSDDNGFEELEDDKELDSKETKELGMF